jgi:uncharacterized protein (TIGR02266 family)
LSTHERRRHFRGKSRAGRRVDLTYRRADDDGAEPVRAVTRNIGVGGAYILTDEPFEIGALLHVELHVPTDEQPLALRAEVRWIAAAADDNDTAGMGVRFLDVDVDAVLKLSEYFASLTGAE